MTLTEILQLAAEALGAAACEAKEIEDQRKKKSAYEEVVSWLQASKTIKLADLTDYRARTAAYVSDEWGTGSSFWDVGGAPKSWVHGSPVNMQMTNPKVILAHALCELAACREVRRRNGEVQV